MALHLNTRLQLLDCRQSLFTTERLTPEEFQGNSGLPLAQSTPGGDILFALTALYL